MIKTKQCLEDISKFLKESNEEIIIYSNLIENFPEMKDAIYYNLLKIQKQCSKIREIMNDNDLVYKNEIFDINYKKNLKTGMGWRFYYKKEDTVITILDEKKDTLLVEINNFKETRKKEYTFDELKKLLYSKIGLCSITNDSWKTCKIILNETLLIRKGE